MATGQNTYAIAQAIQTLLQGVTWTAVGGITAYSNVFIGEQKIYAGKVPCAVIRFRKASTKRYTTGGQTKDYPHFYIRDYIDFTTQEAALVAEQLLFASRDAASQPFVKHSQVGGGVDGVLIAKLVEDSEIAGYLPVGKYWYRVREYVVETAFQYGVPGGFVS